ncbi:4'-phosphopantetheinyl transferase superfamily protein [Priestia flexa]|uniref:Uncharacterized protein n=1 Tax=Priestia veravalensis TaxID=1414648 RepID=A0A0V8JNV1_9BACI|nr:4'-phosphopantetheinyl transferase superfamily protein [Priestia flexa]KSU88604.1 hypothetical protein AS180_06930 [Priestia veravalensis]KZB91930.1 hypothetical protein A2U94_08460 [Bacillus sp. VT 712]MBN8433267.1 4'-phosphopantetheinyl transferase superfamily protein [Priestia flexa]UIR30772.1 4'-phosphopantetheinyl transferase superfamily protein [Priestia flexa]SCC09045.1 4'-phosphopantetheinyl transferase [Priestia flexa]
MVHIYICQLPKTIDDDALNKIASQLSLAKQKQIKRFFHLEDSYRTAIGELLVRYGLYRKYNVIPKELTFHKNKYGKPFVPEYPDFQYNISHSGEFVVCAVHDKSVGVDIEKVQSIDMNIAKGFFTEEEYKEVIKESENKITAFYRVWTLKESYIKATGEGMSRPLTSFQIQGKDEEPITAIDTVKNKPIKNICFKQQNIGDSYQLSVCAYEPCNVSQLIHLSLSDLCHKLKILC